MAYEQIHGPLLVQERVDVGFAALSYYLVTLLGKKTRLKPKDFLPPWLRPKPRVQSAEELRLYLESWAGGVPSRQSAPSQ